MSIKGAARATRATKDGKFNVNAVCEVVSEEQSLPSPLDDFFDRQSNKISYQNLFVQYCSSHYISAKPLYLAGGLISDPDKYSELRASHEEADDNIMFSVSKIHGAFCTSLANCFFDLFLKKVKVEIQFYTVPENCMGKF